MVAKSLLLVGAGALLSNVVKTLGEPAWAKEVRKNLSVVRLMPDGSEWPLAFEFVGAGGWETTVTSNYVGWRGTGIGKGDSDAWITIFLSQDDVPSFNVYGYSLVVSYNGVTVEPRTGEYRHTLQIIT